MIPLVSTDPSDIANAARCFLSCGTDQQALKTYLLTQTADIATPPCVTPAAPGSVRVSGARVDDPTTQLGVTWLQAANSGSLITGYIVYWGTTSGVYTNNSGKLPVSPKNYTITGLSLGTTYFVVVQAVTSIANCVSANSAEASATTTGMFPILVSLASWWKLDEATNAATWVDSVGTNNLTRQADPVTSTNGVINTMGSFALAGHGLRVNSNASLQFGAGVSKSFSLWFSPTTIVFDMLLMGKWDDSGGIDSNAEYALWMNGGVMRFRVRNLANNADVTVSSSFQFSNPPGGVVIHVACGYDDATQVAWISVNGETKVTSPCVGVRSSTVPFCVGCVVNWNGGTFGIDGTLDEVSMWNRTLTQSEVYQLASGYSLTGMQASQSAGVDNANRFSTKVVSNGGAALAANTITGLGNIIDGLIAQSAYIGCLMFNFSDNLTACRTPWNRTANLGALFTNDNFVAGDVTVNGLTGNGTNKDLIGFGLNLIYTNANSAAALRYVYNCPNTAGGVEDGCLDVGANGINFAANLGNATFSRIGGPNNLINGAGGIVPAVGNGCYIDSRVSSTDHRLYFANSTTPFAQVGPTDVTANPGTIPTTNITIFAQRFNNVVGNWSASTMSLWILFGTGLSSAQAQAIFNAVQAGLTNRGGGYR